MWRPSDWIEIKKQGYEKLWFVEGDFEAGADAMLRAMVRWVKESDGTEVGEIIMYSIFSDDLDALI